MPLAPPALDRVPGRRERKKDQTRRALVEAAIRLFAERGFEATTVEEIADAVDVSSRTFHRYFAVKEDVLFPDWQERLDHFVAALASRPEDEDILVGLHAASHDLALAILADADLERARHGLIDASPALRAHGLRGTDEWARVVAEHTARRLRLDAEDQLPQLLAACAVATIRNARRLWVADPTTDLAAEIDRGFMLVGDLGAAAATPHTRTR